MAAGVSRFTVANWLGRIVESGLGKNYRVHQGRAPKFTLRQRRWSAT